MREDKSVRAELSAQQWESRRGESTRHQRAERIRIVGGDIDELLCSLGHCHHGDYGLIHCEASGDSERDPPLEILLCLCHNECGHGGAAECGCLYPRSPAHILQHELKGTANCSVSACTRVEACRNAACAVDQHCMAWHGVAWCGMVFTKHRLDCREHKAEMGRLAACHDCVRSHILHCHVSVHWRALAEYFCRWPRCSKQHPANPHRRWGDKWQPVDQPFVCMYSCESTQVFSLITESRSGRSSTAILAVASEASVEPSLDDIAIPWAIRAMRWRRETIWANIHTLGETCTLTKAPVYSVFLSTP